MTEGPLNEAMCAQGVPEKSRQQIAYEIFRGGFRGPVNSIPTWSEAPTWVRDAVNIAYLQGKLDAAPSPPPSDDEFAGATPGPWQIGTSCDHTPAVMVPVPAREGSGFVVAHINRLPRMGSVRGDMEANARLIAAAPDLLAACREAINSGLEDMHPESVRIIRAAIAKATGAQP